MPLTHTPKRRLSVNLADVSTEGLRKITDILTAESFAAKLAGETAAHPETRQRQIEARARLIESGKRIDRFLDR